ncbi:ParA family protein [Mucilaginibacter rubeus]|uniref:ParA family protein n=1 Tax=Mucilaginibacter rubeus TaxID=2027860 RepID=A0AAE6JBV7_9SPHI|nr:MULTISPECIES: ParA family protein [Mucilaginibacter]QEM02787.1 ParA family protein [Mucilaginibacter rubeus]QEM15405.1 ParA family protein [Mucilaginibacter gossypii]QTE41866.1 ParA family protein [Mucilaginibacter rubeus]QTE48469.1 ParA family protein [Mucilaginibacter rubeus]QTE59855.1 ParA family protein [Mucilaginibacter rubeus]
MQSIVVFNNKGGVGKTTLMCNIAAYLKIKKRKKVLIVDADPQCNATAYMFPYPQIEDIYSKSESTIFEIVKPLQRGKGYISNKLPILKSPYFEVDVIPGDTQLSLSEDFLSKDWLDGKAGDFRGLQTTLLFKDLLLRLDKYDYVFFDVGPSLGALNRSVLAASDFFIVPMSSDIFSLQALENISKSLKDWEKQLSRGLSDFKTREQEPFQIDGQTISWHLQFGGYVTQQYTAKTVNGKKQPVNAYERIIKKIPSTIQKHLLTLNKISITYPQIGEITNLHSLVPLSQNSSVPIFNLKSEHGVVGAHFNKVREYEATLSEMVEKLITNLN